ncbi:hypothetical protein CAP47_01010 [Psychroflexus sp. S27]|nr:hypothetical protein CAP47_01010 [Psychroflexus sp. S27]
MKRIFALICLSVLFVSCSTSKIERQSMRSLDGDWTLTDISYPGSSGLVDVTLFNTASMNCFQNSSWNFVSNNNTGNFVLYGSDCPSGEQNFAWNIETTESNTYNFTLKPLTKGVNPQKINKGYSMEITQLNDFNMTTRQTVQYNGAPFIVQMEFSKNR